jgi:hypothetical protein
MASCEHGLQIRQENSV